MTGYERIRVTFRRLGEACHAAKLTESGKLIPAAGQKFVNIGLMSHVKHQTVNGGIKNSLNGNRQFNNTQIRSQMASCLSNTVDQKFSDFMTKLLQFFI